MRHQVRGNRLNRPADHRRAMLRNMVTSLFKTERITTTVTKAKEARRSGPPSIGENVLLVFCTSVGIVYCSSKLFAGVTYMFAKPTAKADAAPSGQGVPID